MRSRFRHHRETDWVGSLRQCSRLRPAPLGLTVLNLENHPEKIAAEALAKVGGDNDWLDWCVDTGWYW